MNQVDYQAAADFAKISMRGIRTQQLGEMKLEEKDRGCDLVVEYTKAPRFDEGVLVLSLSICFNTVHEASHARDVLRHGAADLGADPIIHKNNRRDPSFAVDL